VKARSLAAAALSALFLGVFLGAWHLATLPKVESQGALDEYARLMGKGAKKSEGFPTPLQLAEAAITQLSEPLYDRGPNDKGIAIQLGYSLGRVAAGFMLAMLVAVPLGFLIGMSPLLHQALNPIIQVLKPISPLAWMPLALYTIKDSSVSGIFVIFI
jgi:nitrate/nitrite transport system permease protein